jgi:hypothetical protein
MRRSGRAIALAAFLHSAPLRPLAATRVARAACYFRGACVLALIYAMLVALVAVTDEVGGGVARRAMPCVHVHVCGAVFSLTAAMCALMRM